MKDQLISLLRHATTALAGLGGFLAYRGLIAPEDSAAVDAAGASLGEALIVVLVAVVSRQVIFWMAKMGLGKAVAKSGGSSPLLALGGMLLLLMTAASLTSCADYNGPRIVLGVEHEEGTLSYDSAKGGTVTVNARVDRASGK
jgi:hypothetical protein